MPDRPDPRTVAQSTPPDPPSDATLPSSPAATGAWTDRTRVQSEPPTHPPHLLDVPGYTVMREVARGGMGVVYVAHDPTFDRAVAVKVMHHGQDAERFVVESKITAQLPHPGVPPVYGLGALHDGRPYLVMKLIEGRTLSDELRAARPADLPRLLGCFERICETVGFAHSRGIIHRDLKPSNVMVGAFGEVLVMDWGLARQARGEGGSTAEPFSVRCSEFRAPHPTETRAGQVKGTPAYMAPEQARGEPVDARTDVFALGGVLCAILTGKAPFSGTTGSETVLMAANADLGAAFERLDASGADDDLLAIAETCLAANPADRYPSGKEVAAAVAAYRASVEERLRLAERDRASAEARAAEEVNTRREAEARAAEQRKRRRVQTMLAGALALLFAAAGGFGWWLDRQAQERQRTEERSRAEQQRIEAEGAARLAAEQEFKARQARDGIQAALKLSADLRTEYKFSAASAALAQAVKFAESGAPELLATVRQAQADLGLVVQLDDVRFRKWGWIAEAGGTGGANAATARGRFSTQTAPSAYRQALAAHGLDLAALDPAEAAKRIAASAVRADLVAAVDDWALYEPQAALRDRLLEIARRADPDPWRDRLRDARTWTNTAALENLAAEVNFGHNPPATLSVLAELLRRRDLGASEMLSRARVRYPADFELAFVLGHLESVKKTGQPIGPYEAARARRPENPVVWNNLGSVLLGKMDPDGAIAALNRAIELDRAYAVAHYNLGVALLGKGDTTGARAAFKRAAELDPKDPVTYYNLGGVLHAQGDLDGAIAAYKRAIELDPGFSQAHNNLGTALREKGDADGAIAALTRAIELDPRDALAQYNLGNALIDKDDLNGAFVAFKRAIELDPKLAIAHSNLSGVYFHQKRYADAARAAQGAIDVDPKMANAHVVLGLSRLQLGDLPGGRAALTEVARLDKQWEKLLAQLPPLPAAPPPREVKP